MKNHTLRLLTPLLLVPLLFWGCTDLEETPYGLSTPDNFFKTEAELVAAVMPVYNALRTASWSENVHLQDHSSDAIFVPTRGGDWDDGALWRDLQTHSWTPTHAKLNQAWLESYRGVAFANATLDNLSSSPDAETALVKTFIAETRVLRATFYWWLVDLYGNIPLVTDPTTDPKNPPPTTPRAEVYDFIVAEIIAALPGLDEVPSGYGRVSKSAANALLAMVYLNAEVYSGTARWTECVAACDVVINSGMFKLADTIKEAFALENEGIGNTEYIWVVGNLAQGGVGNNRHMASLHYSQLPSSPWNGFSVLADFYNKYDPDDARIDMILVGQQFVLGGPSIGDSAFQRDGVPLVFTVESPISGASESHGPRMLKWPIDPDMSGGDAGNDYAIFRYSHILLAKAEAKFMLGDAAAATSLVNQVRARNFDPPKPVVGTVTLDDIFDERGFEFLWEGSRRQDQIRTGHWGDTWSNHDTPSADFKKLFPIPQVQMDANPNLVQNTGY